MNAGEADVSADFAYFMRRYRDKSIECADECFQPFKNSFVRLKAAVDELGDESAVNLQSDFEALRASISKIRAQFPTNTEAPDFNIFSILRISHLEAKTHTPFLAELLDPRGSHEQGDLFLSSFLSLEACSLEPVWSSQGDWRVHTEYYTPKGILDIIIWNRQMKQIVVIENKIFSDDKTDQLHRYYEWLTEHSHFTEESKRRLIYLTPHGNKPTGLVQGVCYKCMSYQWDIRAWLERTIPKVESPRVSDCLFQYLDVIMGF